MEGYYKNKYRIKSSRRVGHDYSQDGYYFITICTYNKEEILGVVKNSGVVFTDIGRYVFQCWIKISGSFPFVKLDVFVIMPNHIHGILIVKNKKTVETRRGASLQCGASASDEYKNKFGPLQKNSISSIVNHFKGNVKKWCNKNGYENFYWQPRFHDRIIRNDIELNEIRQYIIDNPLKWRLDRNNINNK